MLPPDVPVARPFGAHTHDTSEYMAGATAVGIWLLESPDHALDWTEEQEAETVAGIQAAMEAWARKGGPPASLTSVFEVRADVMMSADPLVDCGDDSRWISEALVGAGYSYDFNEYYGCAAYNNDLRAAHDTDWAFSIFVVNTPDNSNASCSPPGSVAWAYLGGPYVYMLRFSTWAAQSYDYQVTVPMHEFGHTFMATDEYDAYITYSGYLDVPDRAFPVCVMNVHDSTSVCQASRDQFGWRDLDADGVIEPLDVPPVIAAALQGSDPSPIETVAYSGSVTVGLVPNLNRNSSYTPGHAISVDRISAVQARVDGGAWAEVAPSDGAFDGYTETFTWSSPPLPDGLHIVEFRAPTDFGAGAEPSARDSVWILVGTTDRHPLVQAPVEALGVEGTEIAVDVVAWDPDGESLSSLTADLSALPAGATFAAGAGFGTGALRWTPGYEDAGDYVVTFHVENALSDATDTTLRVANTDRGPVVAAPSTVEGSEGRLLEFGATASDPDGDPITQFQADLASLPAGHAASFEVSGNASSAIFRWTPTCVDAGSYVVTLRAINAVQGESFLSGEVQTTLSIANDCSATIVPIEDVVVVATSSASVGVSIFDLNGDEISVATSLPPFATLATLYQYPGEFSGRIDLLPVAADTGNYVAQVIATIGGLSDVEQFRIEVTPPVTTSIDAIAWESAEVSATPERVAIRWRLSDFEGAWVGVDRSRDGSAWETLAKAREVVDATLEFEDSGVREGERYGYRLWTTAREARRYSGTLWVDVPHATPVPPVPRVERIAPNPTPGQAVISFAVP
ncbi:MAG TPA: putative Ig domain-containing protein, partial [Acidobacteriota bacterium]|nr:putative Ig domain-containing protein [Acidobacteriota bacterium]